MNRRRRWLRRFLWMLAFGCLWLNVFDDPPLWTDAYVQHVTQEAASVCVVSTAKTSAVLVVRDGEGREVARAESPPGRRHAPRVNGLRPGAEYRYELTTADGGRWEGRFKTAPTDDRAEVRFAFCGDSGGQPWWVWLQRTPILHYPARWEWFPARDEVTRVGQGMAEWGPHFALHLGDVVYPKGLHAHYRSGFFRPFAALLRDAPMYPVPGNHDVMNDAGRQLWANFALPTNAVTGDERCFSFAYGSVRVIGLDCNTWLAGDHFDESHPSRQFLLEQLRVCSEPWIVVASHFPMRSASRSTGNGELLRYLAPELEKWQASLYLAGHDHCYERYGPNEIVPVPLIVSGGGGKSLYDISSNPRLRRGAEKLEKSYHWCSAKAAGRVLRIEAWVLGGKRLDRVDLQLPAGAALDRLRSLNPGRARRIEAL